ELGLPSIPDLIGNKAFSSIFREYNKEGGGKKLPDLPKAGEENEEEKWRALKDDLDRAIGALSRALGDKELYEADQIEAFKKGREQLEHYHDLASLQVQKFAFLKSFEGGGEQFTKENLSKDQNRQLR